MVPDNNALQPTHLCCRGTAICHGPEFPRTCIDNSCHGLGNIRIERHLYCFPYLWDKDVPQAGGYVTRTQFDCIHSSSAFRTAVATAVLNALGNIMSLPSFNRVKTVLKVEVDSNYGD